jgi:hypothetical protein
MLILKVFIGGAVAGNPAEKSDSKPEKQQKNPF